MGENALYEILRAEWNSDLNCPDKIKALHMKSFYFIQKCHLKDTAKVLNKSRDEHGFLYFYCPQAAWNSVHTFVWAASASAPIVSIISDVLISTSEGRVRKLLYSSEICSSAALFVE